MNEIIDGICQRFGTPPVDGQCIRATFCDERAVDHRAADALVKEGKVARLTFDASCRSNCPSGYTPYWDRVDDLFGAFCPVFKLYFPNDKETPKVLLLLPMSSMSLVLSNGDYHVTVSIHPGKAPQVAYGPTEFAAVCVSLFQIPPERLPRRAVRGLGAHSPHQTGSFRPLKSSKCLATFRI